MREVLSELSHFVLKFAWKSINDIEQMNLLENFTNFFICVVIEWLEDVE
jgi:hypothetical protein